MRELAAFVRQEFLSATSYRLNTVLRLAGLLALVVPVYFIAGALQPLMADSIRGQGGHYFAFLVVGLIGERVVAAAQGALPTAVLSGIRTGTLEAWFATPWFRDWCCWRPRGPSGRSSPPPACPVLS
jgi:hypothetical protein